MQARWKVIIILLLLASASAWLLNKIGPGRSTSLMEDTHEPDYYMENFTTWSMEKDGGPKTRLQAEYMAHYPDNDTTELLKPRLELYRKDRPPINVIADKGWVTNNNEVVLLSGNVKFWEDDAEGNRKLEITTTEARILTGEEYAETDKPVTLIREQTKITATGARAWLKESRLELLDNVRTIIPPDKQN